MSEDDFDALADALGDLEKTNPRGEGYEVASLREQVERLTAENRRLRNALDYQRALWESQR